MKQNIFTKPFEELTADELLHLLRSDPFEPYWKKCEVVFQLPKDDEVEV